MALSRPSTGVRTGGVLPEPKGRKTSTERTGLQGEPRCLLHSGGAVHSLHLWRLPGVRRRGGGGVLLPGGSWALLPVWSGTGRCSSLSGVLQQVMVARLSCRSGGLACRWEPVTCSLGQTACPSRTALWPVADAICLQARKTQVCATVAHFYSVRGHPGASPSVGGCPHLCLSSCAAQLGSDCSSGAPRSKFSTVPIQSDHYPTHRTPTLAQGCKQRVRRSTQVGSRRRAWFKATPDGCTGQ